MTWVVAQQFQGRPKDIINVAAGGTVANWKHQEEKCVLPELLLSLVELFFITVLLFLILFMGFLVKGSFPKMDALFGH